MHTTVIELDQFVVEIAKAHFGFCESEKMSVCVGDGLNALD